MEQKVRIGNVKVEDLKRMMVESQNESKSTDHLHLKYSTSKHSSKGQATSQRHNEDERQEVEAEVDKQELGDIRQVFKHTKPSDLKVR